MARETFGIVGKNLMPARTLSWMEYFAGRSIQMRYIFIYIAIYIYINVLYILFNIQRRCVHIPSITACNIFRIFSRHSSYQILF